MGRVDVIYLLDWILIKNIKYMMIGFFGFVLNKVFIKIEWWRWGKWGFCDIVFYYYRY